MERDRGMDDHLVYRNETENARPKTRICWNQWEALVLFATISFMANIYHFLWSNHIATNRSPDMLDATSANQYESRVFTGALTYNKSTRRAVRLQDGPVEYFGPPTEAVDIAWEDLLHGQYMEMTSDEAAPFRPELRTFANTEMYYFEPDVFHSLHCLNAVRLAISPYLYPETEVAPHWYKESHETPEGWAQTHLDHCMDRIRQSLMCHGDLTPSPLYSWEGFSMALGRSGAHTCKKWESIREWMERRASRGSTLMAP